jgi:hypothetical protein
MIIRRPSCLLLAGRGLGSQLSQGAEPSRVWTDPSLSEGSTNVALSLNAVISPGLDDSSLKMIPDQTV